MCIKPMRSRATTLGWPGAVHADGEGLAGRDRDAGCAISGRLLPFRNLDPS
jgi:hypothetical protein